MCRYLGALGNNGCMNVTSLLVQQVYIPFSVAPYTFLQHYNKVLNKNRLTGRGMGDGGGETKKERERERVQSTLKKETKKNQKKHGCVLLIVGLLSQN